MHIKKETKDIYLFNQMSLEASGGPTTILFNLFHRLKLLKSIWTVPEQEQDETNSRAQKQ